MMSNQAVTEDVRVPTAREIAKTIRSLYGAGLVGVARDVQDVIGGNVVNLLAVYEGELDTEKADKIAGVISGLEFATSEHCGMSMAFRISWAQVS